MNNLTDLTFNKKTASLFGYTEEELESNFSDYIDEYLKRDDREYKRREEFLSAIRDYYDGYRFSYESTVEVYNPVSVGKFFTNECVFEPYWINTGVSTLAVELAKDYHLGSVISENPIIGLDTISTFDYSLLRAKKLDSFQILSLLYFTGYLTIEKGNSNALTLTFPNNEVRIAFTKNLVKLYTKLDISAYIEKARMAVAEKDLIQLVNILNAYYEKIPYVILTKEVGFQSMFYAFFILMGVDSIDIEERTMLGRIDVVIKAKDNVYIIEMKVDRSAEEAIKQIKDKRYYARYINSEKTIHLIGMNFSSTERQIKEWKEEIVDKTKEKTYFG